MATPGSEVPERVDVIREALERAGHRSVEARPHGDEVLLRVHDAALVSHLQGVHDEWMAGDYVELVGQDRVVPYVFPTAAMLGGLPVRRARAVHARAGQFGYDTMTLVGAGTSAAARAAVDCALTAVDLVRGGLPLAYALCRPPGHHATRSGSAGRATSTTRPSPPRRCATAGTRGSRSIDLDAHHGNGTAAIFYSRADVAYGSVHVDPGAGWFPHFVGFADETGTGGGRGATLNLPLRARNR